jgi:hypothetical protein
MRALSCFPPGAAFTEGHAVFYEEPHGESKDNSITQGLKERALTNSTLVYYSISSVCPQSRLLCGQTLHFLA